MLKTNFKLSTNEKLVLFLAHTTRFIPSVLRQIRLPARFTDGKTTAQPASNTPLSTSAHSTAIGKTSKKVI